MTRVLLTISLFLALLFSTTSLAQQPEQPMPEGPRPTQMLVLCFPAEKFHELKKTDPIFSTSTVISVGPVDKEAPENGFIEIRYSPTEESVIIFRVMMDRVCTVSGFYPANTDQLAAFKFKLDVGNRPGPSVKAEKRN